jgi:prophage antirepressor
MNELQVFKNAEFGSVRTAIINGEVFFVGKDVAEILGYSNPRKALADHVDAEDKIDGVTIRDSIGREQMPILINESGLYSLILRSQLPKANQFKRWVTSEVLPAIRKHGMFAVEEIMNNPDLLIHALTELKEEREKRKSLELTSAVQKQQIAELQPKASYYDLILQNKDTLSITQIAKDYGMSGRRLNELLKALGVQYRFRKTWLLYQDYADMGYTQSKTFALDAEKSVMHTYWTQKGRLFLYDLLKREGILPVIEQEV